MKLGSWKSVTAVAKELDLTKHLLRKLMEQREISVCHIGGRTFIDPSEVENVIEAKIIPAVETVAVSG